MEEGHVGLEDSGQAVEVVDGLDGLVATLTEMNEEYKNDGIANIKRTTRKGTVYGMATGIGAGVTFGVPVLQKAIDVTGADAYLLVSYINENIFAALSDDPMLSRVAAVAVLGTIGTVVGAISGSVVGCVQNILRRRRLEKELGIS